MSWDIFIQDFPSSAQSVADIPDDFRPRPIGSRTEMIARICRVFPKAWYRDLLGFHVENLNASDERAAALMMRGSALVELAQFFDAESSTAVDRYLEHGIFKLGFQVRDIDATFERLEQNDAEVFFPIVELRQNRRTFAVKDPDVTLEHRCVLSLMI